MLGERLVAVVLVEHVDDISSSVEDVPVVVESNGGSAFVDECHDGAVFVLEIAEVGELYRVENVVVDALIDGSELLGDSRVFIVESDEVVHHGIDVVGNGLGIADGSA